MTVMQVSLLRCEPNKHRFALLGAGFRLREVVSRDAVHKADEVEKPLGDLEVGKLHRCRRAEVIAHPP